MNHALLFDVFLYDTSVLLCFLVVVDANEEKTPSPALLVRAGAKILGNLGRIILLLYLINGSNGTLVIFQLYNHCWFVAEFARDKHKVCKALSSGKLTMDDIFILCINVRNGEYA